MDETRTRDEQGTNEQLSSKIQRKLRLVKFEKVKKGNTVIHRQVDFSARSLAIPQLANYEELLQPVPPLITLNNDDQRSRQSRRLSISTSQQNIPKRRSKKNIDIIAPFQSYSVLSSVEEEPSATELSSSQFVNQHSVRKENIIKLHAVDEPSTIPRTTVSVSSAPPVALPPVMSPPELPTPSDEEQQASSTTLETVELLPN